MFGAYGAYTPLVLQLCRPPPTSLKPVLATTQSERKLRQEEEALKEAARQREAEREEVRRKAAAEQAAKEKAEKELMEQAIAEKRGKMVENYKLVKAINLFVRTRPVPAEGDTPASWSAWMRNFWVTTTGEFPDVRATKIKKVREMMLSVHPDSCDKNHTSRKEDPQRGVREYQCPPQKKGEFEAAFKVVNDVLARLRKERK